MTDALGVVRTFTNTIVNGISKNSGVTLPCTTCDALSYLYDANGFISRKIDFNNNRTNYTHDARGLETLRVEGLTSGGAATPATRTITTEWHASYRLPTRIAEPFRLTTMTYGAASDPSPGNRGSLLTKTVQATTDATGSLGFSAALSGAPRMWTYTYNDNGQVLTVNGPRTDVADITSYAYYANNATCSGTSAIGCRGQINTITNAAGHVTTITSYNAHGQPLTIVDPNGLVTTLGYDLSMRLTSRNVGGELTSYTYDNAGQLIRVTLPDASFLTYIYDAAHRLIQIAANLGNKVSYTLDAMGNRTREDVLDPVNALAQTRSRVYNNLNRLSLEIGAANQTTAYSYDNQGNVTSVDGPLAGTVDVTTRAYDALNRLIRVTDPGSGQINYGYNGRDQLVSVSDPRSLVTSYAYDGLDNLNQLVSPDTGTTNNTYDPAGNILTATDAKGQVTSYAYDALNRVTSITYHDGVTHTYQYDQGANGLGRLTQITEPNSTTQYAYDQKGRLTTESRVISGVTYATSYGYDSAGRLISVLYPGGRQVAYTLDSMGRVQQIATSKNSITQTILSGVTYRPFGPVQSFTFGNGQTYNRGYDQDGRTTSYTLANVSMAVGYDAASRLTSLAQVGNPANTGTFSYDTNDRLTSFIDPSLSHSFTYDAVGNRLSKVVGSASSTYAYPPNSNRVSQITGSNARSYTHDPVGSITADAVNTFAYDTRGRMAQSVGILGATDYKVNSLGQRIRKTSAQGDTVYHYDAAGKLIAESSAAGVVQKEYVYLGDIPVAVLQ